jgi:hypothetical protein
MKSWGSNQYLASIVLFGLISQTTLPALGLSDISAYNKSLNLAFDYLISNYNPEVGLIRVSPDSPSLRNTYYVYSDNLLASFVILNYSSNKSQIEIALNITNTIRHYISPQYTNQYEALLGKADGFFPSRDIILYNKNGLNILATVADSSLPKLNPREYADIGFLETVYYVLRGPYRKAVMSYNDALRTWDGTGFRDKAFNEPSSDSYHQYQTYKLALYIYASKELGSGLKENILNMLMSLQSTTGQNKGGFYTCYAVTNNRLCLTNTETTAIAALAIAKSMREINWSFVVLFLLVFSLFILIPIIISNHKSHDLTIRTLLIWYRNISSR